MKHAYLIMAHHEFEVLQKLIEAIDDERNDIYVHIDKKVRRMPALHCEHSKLYVLGRTARVSVYWATTTQIAAELSLFKQAYQRGKYSYYHLVSGVHLPLKSQDFLHRFYDSCYDKQVLRLYDDTPQEATDFKLRRYHFFVRFFRNKRQWVCALSLFLSNACLFFQKRAGLFRRERVYAKSDNWVSITEKAVAYLLSHEERILKEYRYTFCADEYFVASELRRSPQRFEVRNVRHLLLADFVGPSPRCYDCSDYEHLVGSGYLFARKFSSRHIDVVNAIVQHVKRN